MRTFTEYLTEDKSRFIKKNKNLTDNQKKEIIKFFKVNRQAEKKVDWNKSASMTIDDFENIMIQTKSGRKTKLKHQKIKGLKEGTDYVAVRMKTKEYLAYIPLTFDAAQKFNTRELGVCSGPWCIGHSGNAYHWNDEVIDGEQVPVYVVNTRSKWVVMIQEGNRKYDIWTVDNNPKKVHEGIPNFSVRKELLNPSQKKMYDEIREDYFDEETDTEIDVDDAIIDYDALVEAIDSAASAAESAQEWFNDETYRIKQETTDKYEEQKQEADEEIGRINSRIGELKDQIETIEYMDETDFDEDGEVEFEGSYYSEEGIEGVKSELESDNENLDDELSDAETEYNEAVHAISKIEDIEQYEMNDHDIDWVEDPPTEDNIYYDINIPSVADSDYSDYIDVMEEHGGFSIRYSGDKIDDDIRGHVYSFHYGGSEFSSSEELLSYHDLNHPEILNEN